MFYKPSFAMAVLLAATCSAQAASDNDLAAIRSQINEIKQSYEQRIAALEQKLAQAESKGNKPEAKTSNPEVVTNEARLNVRQPQTSASAFNPEISLILSGSYTNLKQNPSERRLQGFIPSNGELMPENRSFNLGESELVIAANIDPMFRGTLRLALAPDNTLGVEEASVQTLGLGNGFNLKAGRFLSGVGYLNEMHPHEWDFSNAPLPYQAFFGNALGMDGVQARWLAPTPIFLEFGAETARAMSFPATDESKSKNGLMSASAFVHVGGDLGVSNSWRGGISYFAAQAKDREYQDPLNNPNNMKNSFSGSSRTWIADLLWKWSPNGNAKQTNLKLQGEYFRRSESGDLVYDTANTAQQGDFKNTQSGFYAQAVYQFMPNWRVGYRYDRLSSGSANIELINNGTLTAADLPLLANYSPSRNTLMVD